MDYETRCVVYMATSYLAMIPVVRWFGRKNDDDEFVRTLFWYVSPAIFPIVVMAGAAYTVWLVLYKFPAWFLTADFAFAPPWRRRTP